MPQFSTDDFHKRLQKMAVLEMKMQRLQLNVEVNGLGWNDTTLPVLQKNGKGHANLQLVSSYKDSKEQEGCVPGNTYTSGSPPWNSLSAKPKSKSFPWDLGERITGRVQRPEICDATGWPALLSPRKSASSTPLPTRKQPWTAAKGITTNRRSVCGTDRRRRRRVYRSVWKQLASTWSSATSQGCLMWSSSTMT
ncbi:guanylate kinase 1b isoform X1 [Trematomus bernacchii]|uniref:guanylate kinase 1b isoform X1 n=1 Tax=Trematomus bernacchii TaxID=40690 RepID=UPI001469B1E6|nr:guanylate kinase 1b isoform X1 [Trematomus bernacchii]